MLIKYQNKLTDLSGNMEYREYIMNSEIEKVLEEDRKYRDGLVDGRYEGKKEMVINMVLEKIPLETISKVTNLTIEEIEKIADNHE